MPGTFFDLSADMIQQGPQSISSTDDKLTPDNHRVLVVDDEPAICFAYRKLLESERFGFDICESVESAIEMINSTDYFAVISDLRFAGTNNMGGVYLIETVRKIQPEAKIILVTGYGNDELQKTAHELGVSHYFEKPVGPSIILSLLRGLHLIADKENENEYFNNLIIPEVEVA